MLPSGTKSSYIKAKKESGINFRFTITNYKKHSIVRKKIFNYFFKNLDISSKTIKENEKKNIFFLKKINCYRGVRHKSYLPVRGQRTKRNAKTSGKKKISFGPIFKRVKQNAKKN